MKYVVTAALAGLVFANPSVAQIKPPTQVGGGSSITVHSTKGSHTMQDATAHTQTGSGATVSTSTEKNEGKTPNGGVREEEK